MCDALTNELLTQGEQKLQRRTGLLVNINDITFSNDVMYIIAVGPWHGDRE